MKDFKENLYLYEGALALSDIASKMVLMKINGNYGLQLRGITNDLKQMKYIEKLEEIWKMRIDSDLAASLTVKTNMKEYERI